MPLAFQSIDPRNDLPAKLASLRLTLCGAGAIGSNLADALARQGARRLRAIDHDRVEPHNIATQIYREADVGVWKVEALRNHLFGACGIEIEAVRKELKAENARGLLKDSDLIVDGFDNAASRQFVQNHARASGVACLHVGLHADYCEVIWDEHYRVPGDAVTDGEACEDPLARGLVLLATAIAAETILSWAARGERLSRTATLRDFAVNTLEA